jgi:SAM-dependent methyltransferase
VNFAIEEALRDVAASRVVIRRVAIVGPGLDFTDKQEGYDFYPQQMLQPFAVMNSLIRLQLATADTLSVTTFDLSPRVNEHVDRARNRAGQGTPYVVQLPLDAGVPWTPAMHSYWETFGDRIGVPVSPLLPPRAAGPVKTRAVAVRAPVVQRITSRDLNVTAQHLRLDDTDCFDLIIATNVFVYYDRLQQGLAMMNVARMLRPGGVLLSNNAVVELPASGLKSEGYSRTLYSDREEDGDVIIRYRMQTSPGR